MAGAVEENLGLDQLAHDRAGEMFRVGRSALPPEAVTALAYEVISRLDNRNKAVRVQQAPVAADEIDALCEDLLASDETAGAARVMRAHAAGVSVETLYLGHLAEAARQLGAMWDDDRISSIEVAIATGRIYAIMRGLRRLLGAASVILPDNFRAAFAACPGETHTLGVTMAADQLRRHGWQIDLKVGFTHEDLVEQFSQKPYPIIGLSASCSSMVFPLARLVVALRISNPGAWIMLSGKILDTEPEILALTDVDCAVRDLEEAEAQMRQRMQGRIDATRTRRAKARG